MNLTLILNRDAGTLRGTDAEATAEAIAGIFRARGHDVTKQLCSGKDTVAAIEQACTAGARETLIVGGGDGTVSAAAAFAAKSGTTLGILPLGTMNLFARSLGIPLDLTGAAEALADGRTIAVDIGEVNGHYFVHHVALGLHAMVLKARERLTYASRFGKMRASAQAWWTVARHPPKLSAEIRADERIVRRHTAAILVSNNPLGDGHLPYADDPRQGTLGLYVVKPRDLPSLLGLAVRFLLGAIAENPHLESWLAREIDIAPGAPSIDASVDGEIVTLRAPLRCRLHRRGLNVLAPAVPKRVST